MTSDFDDLLRSPSATRPPLPSSSLYTTDSDDLGFQSNPFADLESSAYDTRSYAAYDAQAERRFSAPSSPVEEKRQLSLDSSPRTRAHSVSSSSGSQFDAEKAVFA